MSDGSSAADGGGAALDLGPGGVGGPGQEAVPRLGARPTPGPRATTMVARSGRSTPVVLEHGHVVGAEEVGHRHQDPGPAPQQDVGGLGALEPGVDRDEHGAGLEEAQRGNDPLGAVERPDGHPVTRLDARGDQGGAEPAGLVDELGVGQPGRPVDDRRTGPRIARRWRRSSPGWCPAPAPGGTSSPPDGVVDVHQAGQVAAHDPGHRLNGTTSFASENDPTSVREYRCFRAVATDAQRHQPDSSGLMRWCENVVLCLEQRPSASANLGSGHDRDRS